MANNLQTHSVEPLPRSATSETKEKFEYFLKTALQKSTPGKNAHQRKIDNESHESDEEENLGNTDEKENREFILNKFFEYDANTRGEKGKPVPKPRTKKQTIQAENSKLPSIPSNETFKVTSPKVVLGQDFVQKISSDEDNSKKRSRNLSPVSSTGTFKISSPKILKPIDLSSEKTYEIPKKRDSKIGDIIIHKKSSSKENVSKIIEVEVKNFKEEINDEDLVSTFGSEISKGSKNMKNEDINTEDQDIFNKIPLENVIHIIIHKTDKLQLNSFVIHPVVKIHIVDINTGNYYPKKHKERPVVYYYDSNLDYIAPIMTHPYNLQEQRSLMPLWEETILINEDFQYLVAEKENIIIFFEILDFVSSSTMNDNTKGWHKIAFAFLKIHGQNNNLNLEKKMRLQLYYCSSKKDDLKKCSVWETWHVRKLKKYPSSLYVTIESAKIKGKICTGLRSKDALQEEVGTENLEIDENVKSNVRKNDAISLLVETMEKSQMWKRSVKDITKLPNKCIAQLKTEEGCFMLNFSNGGQFLACALKVDNIYSIVIFSVVSFKEICHFPGHQGIIYSIRWSSDDSLIIAASADGSCSVWDVKKTSFLQILPHPNFVYSTDIDGEFIVTGCYDTIVRIWKKLGAKFMLHQELEGHKGYITCVRFKKSTNIIFSSDSLGLIIEWSFESNSWSLHRRITIPDLNGIVINQIELMGRGKRLLVHSRDSILRILDLNSLMVIHWLRGGLNQRFQTSCSVSPCGHYIIAGSENSLVNIWKVKNGKYVGNLVPFENKLITVHALQFHPQQDILAVGNYGHDFPVLLFGYDEKSGEAETHLRIIEDHKMESRIDAKEHEQGKNRKRGFHQSDFKSVLHKFDEMMLGKSK